MCQNVFMNKNNFLNINLNTGCAVKCIKPYIYIYKCFSKPSFSINIIKIPFGKRLRCIYL